MPPPEYPNSRESLQNKLDFRKWLEQNPDKAEVVVDSFYTILKNFNRQFSIFTNPQTGHVSKQYENAIKSGPLPDYQFMYLWSIPLVSVPDDHKEMSSVENLFWEKIQKATSSLPFTLNEQNLNYYLKILGFTNNTIRGANSDAQFHVYSNPDGQRSDHRELFLKKVQENLLEE